MGDDFAYKKANETFEFAESIAKSLKSDQFEFIYSTPSIYMEAIRQEAQEKSLTFPIYQKDFFPLLMQYEGHYWSGYFTSRPNIKKLIRDFTYQSFASLFQYSIHIMESAEFKK